VPNARHEGASGSVTISGGKTVNDTTWHTLLTTWCPHFFGLYLDGNLIAGFAAPWTPAMIRRWNADPFGFLRPWNEVPSLMGSASPATPRPAPAWSSASWGEGCPWFWSSANYTGEQRWRGRGAAD
jgi:hypothetical protein